MVFLKVVQRNEENDSWSEDQWYITVGFLNREYMRWSGGTERYWEGANRRKRQLNSFHTNGKSKEANARIGSPSNRERQSNSAT